MLVANHMTRGPVTITEEDRLSDAAQKMKEGRFRWLPVMKGEEMTGILTERDLREHVGFLESTRVSGAMSPEVVSIAPSATVEEAARVLLERKIGGLPVLENGKLVGVITTSDVLRAFLELTGASEEGAVRIDLALEGDRYDLSPVSRIVTEAGGEVLSLGIHPDRVDDRPVVFLRVRATDPESVAETLAEHGYRVLGVHHPVAAVLPGAA